MNKVISMTERYLRKICVQRGLFSTPELNETLYLHCVGFDKIENLDDYVECRTLWL